MQCNFFRWLVHASPLLVSLFTTAVISSSEAAPVPYNSFQFLTDSYAYSDDVCRGLENTYQFDHGRHFDEAARVDYVMLQAYCNPKINDQRGYGMFPLLSRTVEADPPGELSDEDPDPRPGRSRSPSRAPFDRSNAPSPERFAAPRPATPDPSSPFAPPLGESHLPTPPPSPGPDR